MIWEDECYLLSKRKFRENAIIINIFTQKKGKIEGIVYGGTSRKIRNHLQISNKLFVSYTSKNENRIGYFKTELIKPISPLYFSDKERTSALTSICSLLNILLPESQPNKIIYFTFEKLLNSINIENWIFLYIFFEINLIKELGYDTNLKNFKDQTSGKELINIKIDGNFYEVPEYLITGKIPENFNNTLIRKSLYFTRQIMVNKFFVTNNLLFPKSRVILENYFN
ncbi:DNA repair protein RecO [Candidatus Pelagibacter bacterium]|nr:DNA repair protein RecO [Candidatus Pelagibacter bacterium]